VRTFDKRAWIGRVAARGAAAIFGLFAAFQLALALGAPFGAMTWGGASPVLSAPMRAASGAASIYLILAGGAMLALAGDWGRPAPRASLRWFSALLTLQLALNTLANLASKSALERFGMGAASAIGCCLCLTALICAAPRARSADLGED
jgi:hypothetical protein